MKFTLLEIWDILVLSYGIVKQYLVKIIVTITRWRGIGFVGLAVALGCAGVACGSASNRGTSLTTGGSTTMTLEEFRTQKPPGDFLSTRRLVPANRYAREIRWELVYGTARNVAGRPLYPPDMPCLLDVETAKKLGRAQERLREDGLGLLVWDAYRPTAVQRKLFETAGSSGFVANPEYGFSRHASGRAVDVTLYYLATGETLSMPSGFDDFSDQASSNYRGGDPAVARNVALLTSAMQASGFVGIEVEWWHFENSDYQTYDIPPIAPEGYGIRIPE